MTAALPVIIGCFMYVMFQLCSLTAALFDAARGEPPARRAQPSAEAGGQPAREREH